MEKAHKIIPKMPKSMQKGAKVSKIAQKMQQKKLRAKTKNLHGYKNVH